MSDSRQTGQAAFETFASQYDTDGDAWQNMGADEYFIAGYKAASEGTKELIEALERMLPDWHADADDHTVHGGTIIGEITYKDVRKAKEAIAKATAATCDKETTAVECEHDWEVVDDSFDHEFGTQKIVFERCLKCDAEQDHEPRTFDDDVI